MAIGSEDYRNHFLDSWWIVVPRSIAECGIKSGPRRLAFRVLLSYSAIRTPHSAFAMKLAKYRLSTGQFGVGRVEADQLLPFDLSAGQYQSLFDILEADNPYEAAEFLSRDDDRLPLEQVNLLPPIDNQEVWAAGVTYKRSKTARMEESTTAASCYDRVYASPRPELFFKATPHRVAGHGQPLRIRADSNSNLPEPELTLVLSSKLQLVGFRWATT